MEHILTLKGSQPPVDRFSSFVSTEATSRDVHEDDNVTFLAAHVGQPVNTPLTVDLLAAWTDVSETFFSPVRIVTWDSATLSAVLKCYFKNEKLILI